MGDLWARLEKGPPENDPTVDGSTDDSSDNGNPGDIDSVDDSPNDDDPGAAMVAGV